MPETITRDISELHISYEETKGSTIEDWESEINSARQSIMLEIVESFGSYMGDIKREIKTKTEYDIQSIEEKNTKDTLEYGILKLASLTDAFGIGSIEQWKFAVEQMAAWYVENVKSYDQNRYTICPLIDRYVRWDCSGFTTACLQNYGLLKDITFAPNSAMYSYNTMIGKKLEDGGFHKYNFIDWDSAQPYDILCYNGHVEIYAGKINGRHLSYAWGTYHPSLPCNTAHVRQGYDYIWRCEGNGTFSIFNTPKSFNVNVEKAKSPKEVCQACYSTFINIGCTDAAAKGICANIMEESRMNPSIVTWDGSVKSGKFGVGGGLCGFYFLGALPELALHAWGSVGKMRLNTYNELIKKSGLPKPSVPCHPVNSKHIMSKFGGFPFTLKEQLSYLCKIINSGQYFAIKKMTDPREAAFFWERKYEHPAKITDRWAAHGNEVLKLLS